MKPTTTSVFVLPVRPQTSQSQTIYGLSGSAAGAHRPCLLAAQDGQTKSITRMEGGSLARWGCRLFLWLTTVGWAGLFAHRFVLLDLPRVGRTALPTLLLLSSLAYADNTVSGLTRQTPEHAKLTAQLAQTCQQTDNQAPTMVAIRPGNFLMGSPANETGRYDDESPQHQVTIPHPFAISRCEITVGQFRQFIQESGYTTTAETNKQGCRAWDVKKNTWDYKAGNYWDMPGFAQTDHHPVVCVSWHDAQRYVDWLSQRTGALYRLPTEAEWEYAARADTVTSRFYQDNEQCDYANGLGQEAKSIASKDWVSADCKDAFVYTAPVASFAENQFGLFDMLGNVLEWTIDCNHDSYSNPPLDGTAWLEADKGDCVRRVVRGGSWGDDPQYLRSAVRDGYGADAAIYYLGFRIARAL
jgi:formylglycine-generating enzyme required for sulfatase activity